MCVVMVAGPNLGLQYNFSLSSVANLFAAFEAPVLLAFRQLESFNMYQVYYALQSDGVAPNRLAWSGAGTQQGSCRVLC